MKKILWMALLPILLSTLTACDDPRPSRSAVAPLDERLGRLYKRSCVSCHISGAGGAPRIGDKVHWAQVLEKGMPTLVANVRNGYNAMPPMGLCRGCDVDDFAILIEHMVAGGR